MAATSLQPVMANLAAQYADSWTIPKRPPPLATFTIVPEPRSSMRGSTARFMRIGDMKFVRITTSRSSAV